MLIVTILFYSIVWAKPQTLLECLGKEEEYIHQAHISIQTQNFNQKLLSDIIDFQDLPLQNHFLTEICAPSESLKSFKFLEVFLKNKGLIFNLPRGVKDKATSLAQVDNFYAQILQRMSDYISLNQMLSPTPDCLFVAHSAVSTFLFKMLYQSSDLTPRRILHDDDLGLKVLKELKRFPTQLSQCSNLKK